MTSFFESTDWIPWLVAEEPRFGNGNQSATNSAYWIWASHGMSLTLFMRGTWLEAVIHEKNVQTRTHGSTILNHKQEPTSGDLLEAHVEASQRSVCQEIRKMRYKSDL